MYCMCVCRMCCYWTCGVIVRVKSTVKVKVRVKAMGRVSSVRVKVRVKVRVRDSSVRVKVRVWSSVRTCPVHRMVLCLGSYLYMCFLTVLCTYR